MSDTSNVSESTAAKVKAWMYARQRISRLQSEMTLAESDLARARNELGKWLVPNDAKHGEIFNIWFGSGLLGVQLTHGDDYDIKWRKEPGTKQMTELGY